ncbi:MAG: hypothetical protein ACXW01_13730 [Methylobacter sp.]
MFMKTALLQRECELCLRLQAKLPLLLTPLTYIHIGKACTPAISTASVTAIKLRDTLVPKLPLGNPVSKAPALRAGKLELPVLNSQAGAWELAQRLTDEDMPGVCRKRQFSLSLEPAYSGLLRDVYNDERSAWEQEQPAHS